MHKFKVSLGDMNITVNAINHKFAVIVALNKSKPISLGILISCLKKGDSEDKEMFFSSEKVLTEMGIEVIKK